MNRFASLLVGATAALNVGPRTPSGVRRAVAAPSPAIFAVGPMDWKEELEALLSPKTAAEDRGILARDLFARSAEIAGDVAGAVSSGRPDDLLPEQLRKDLSSVQRQFQEDLLPKLPTLLEGSGPQTLQAAATAAASGVGTRGPAAFAALLADPSRAAELASQGLAASVSRDVEGLDAPTYVTLESGEGYELREYAPYAVASCDMELAEGADLVVQLTAGSAAFSALAAFMLGSNGREELLGVTTPVRIDVASAGASAPSTMSFVIPTKYSAASAPAPTDQCVRLEQVPRQTLAVAQFAGLATDGEVARQKEALLARLEADGVVLLEEEYADAYSVFQYNPPYTLPWLRRNEIAVAVAVNKPPTCDEDVEEECVPEPAAVAQVWELIVDEEEATVREGREEGATDPFKSYGDDDTPSDIDV